MTEDDVMKQDPTQPMLPSLDNPIWFALTTEHRFLARSHGLARRYPQDVSPLAALRSPTNDAFADLQRLVSPSEHVAFFTAGPVDVPGDWHVDRSRWIEQMICDVPLASPPVAPLPLGPTDVPEMLELTAATEPGPFLPQTIQMGNYFGIRASNGRLVAMAGERLQSTEFVEISAVCTHPEFRGRGYARDLTTFLAAQILAAGKIPFLHVKSENGAKVVYEKIGFRLRAAIYLTVISLG
jgi:ribosomal protein S18 acetylase RimI-like enzyme